MLPNHDIPFFYRTRYDIEKRRILIDVLSAGRIGGKNCRITFRIVYYTECYNLLM